MAGHLCFGASQMLLPRPDPILLESCRLAFISDRLTVERGSCGWTLCARASRPSGRRVKPIRLLRRIVVVRIIAQTTVGAYGTALTGS